VSLVWSTTPELARELAGLDDESFGARVTEASAGVLGRLLPGPARARFPLRLLHALAYAGPRVVLAGDAAHGVHPLAGQGANLGFLDCAALVQLLGDAIGQGADPGDRAVLRRYERWRKAENVPAMLLMDGLQRLFSTGHPLLSRVRRTGLGLVNRARPLKRTLVERALGLSGEVPQWLAGPPSIPRQRPA
jgi:2-octaprenylphenol hydroxylase